MINLIRRAIPATAAIVASALLVAACGGASPTTSTSGDAKGAANAGPSPTTFTSDAYKYSACMRNHGVSDFPDPVVSHSGNSTKVAIQVPQAAGTSPQFDSARKACQGILPAPSGSDLAAAAQQRKLHTQAFLAFAHCMRNRGINGFPDPDTQGKLSLQMIQAAGIDLTAPQVRAAALACVPASNGEITRSDVIQATSGNPQPSGSASSTNPGG